MIFLGYEQSTHQTIMARKKNKRRKTKKTIMTLQQREAKAKTALENGHYQKAIVNLRQMLKEEERAEWQEDARYAHRQLAEQLSNTKKYRDVVSLYESGAQLCGFSLYTFEYVEALLASKQFDKAIRHYLALHDNSEKTLLKTIRSELAAYVIAGEVKIITMLPENDPVVVDYDTALQLLNAYCATDDQQVEKQLRLLSFRSPYRDLRQIIAAAIQLDSDPVAASEQLARIASESPFSVLANSLQLVTKPPKYLLTSWSTLLPHQQQLIKQLKGWGKEKDKLLKKLATLAQEPTFSDVFRLADSFTQLDPHYLHNVAKKAVIHATALKSCVITLKRFKQRFPQPSARDDFHLEALIETVRFEQGKVDEYDPFGALEGKWKLYQDILETTVGHDDAQKQQALICRYIAEAILAKVDGINERIAEYIEQSLVFDPQDKASHGQLIRYYLDERSIKQAREGVSLALQYYPDDLAILLLAIESAIASKAFKRAATHAKTLLAVDPINREARRLLCQAHLAHSRKQIKAKRWHLVEKELAEAEQWANEPLIEAIILLQKTLMAKAHAQPTKNKNNKSAIELLQSLHVLMKTDLNTSFLIRLEMASIKQASEAKALHQLIKLKWTPAKKQRKAVLFLLMETVNRCAALYDSNTVSQVLTPLAPALKTIVKQDITLAEYEKILDFWQRHKQNALVENYVKAAIKQHNKSPMLTYYNYVNMRSLAGNAYHEIDLAIDVAQEQGDSAIAARLISLLKKYRFSSGGFGGFGGFPDFDDDDDDFFEPHEHQGEGSPASALPEFLRKNIIQLIHHSHIDDVVANMSEILGFEESQLNMLKHVLGEDGLRVVLVGMLEGNTPKEVSELLENKELDDEKPAKKEKKGFFDLFDF